MRIPGLKDEAYVERPASLAPPPLKNDVLTRFAGEGPKLGRRAWMREVREWARNRVGASD